MTFSKPSSRELRSYWLRCWREPCTSDGIQVWRFSLENPHTGERIGFASLQAMTIFLEAQTRQWSEAKDSTDDAPHGNADVS